MTNFTKLTSRSLAITTCMFLKQRGHNLPRGIAVLSPWLDLTCSSEYWTSNSKYGEDDKREFSLNLVDYLPDNGNMKSWSKGYLGQKISAKYPFASPVYADKADLANFPPMLIQVSDK